MDNASVIKSLMHASKQKIVQAECITKTCTLGRI